MNNRVLAVTTAFVLALCLGWYLQPFGVNAQVVVVDRDLASLLPLEANSLIGMDVTRVQSAALYRYLEEKGGSRGQGFGDAIDNFVTVTGFDPRRDVHRVLLASSGDPAQMNHPTDLRFLAAAKGSFDLPSLDEILTATAKEAKEYRGVRVYGFRQEVGGKKQEGDSDSGGEPKVLWFSLAFLDSTTAIAGPRESVLAALDRRFDGGESMVQNAKLLTLAESVPSSNQIWGVSEQPGKFMPEEVPGSDKTQQMPAMRVLQTMRSSTFGLNLMDGLDFEAKGMFASPEDAKLLGDAARGMIAMGRLTLPAQNPELIAFLDSIAVTEDDESVKVSLRMGMQAFEEMIESMKAKQRASLPPNN